VADPGPPWLANVRKPLGLEEKALNPLEAGSILIVRQHPSVDSLDIALDIIVIS